MDLGITNKKALVTGASRGIGASIVKTLLEENVIVMGSSRSESEISHKNYNHLISDLSNITGTKSFIEDLKNINFFPDIIVNNVGGNLGYTDPLKTSLAWEEVSNFNLTNAMIINEAFIPNMVDNKWGRICHVSSISALENQGPPAYCAAKAALNAYVRSLGRYISKDNVILTSIMPGAIFTKNGYWDEASRNRPDHVEKYLKERMAIQRFGNESEVTKIIAVLVSELSSFSPGTSFLVDGGQGRTFYMD